MVVFVLRSLLVSYLNNFYKNCCKPIYNIVRKVRTKNEESTISNETLKSFFVCVCCGRVVFCLTNKIACDSGLPQVIVHARARRRRVRRYKSVSVVGSPHTQELDLACEIIARMPVLISFLNQTCVCVSV